MMETIGVVVAVIISLVTAITQWRRSPIETKKMKVETDALEDANVRDWVKLQLDGYAQAVAILTSRLEQADRTIDRISERLQAVEAELDAEERQAAERERRISQQDELIHTQEMELADLRVKVEHQAEKAHDQANEITRLRAALTRAGFDPDTNPDDITGSPV
jgi:chromosome segregation ATPase